MKKCKKFRAGSEEQYGPSLVGEILNDYFNNSNEPLAVAYRKHKAEKTGWHTNTELGCDLKTILLSGQRMKPGKVYSGLIKCDSENIVDEFLCRDPHFTFVELPPKAAVKHNPRFTTVNTLQLPYAMMELTDQTSNRCVRKMC